MVRCELEVFGELLGRVWGDVDDFLGGQRKTVNRTMKKDSERRSRTVKDRQGQPRTVKDSGVHLMSV
jgi:hypothetical protein